MKYQPKTNGKTPLWYSVCVIYWIAFFAWLTFSIHNFNECKVEGIIDVLTTVPLMVIWFFTFICTFPLAIYALFKGGFIESIVALFWIPATPLRKIYKLFFATREELEFDEAFERMRKTDFQLLKHCHCGIDYYGDECPKEITCNCCGRKSHHCHNCSS
jgi:hypothetical protein